MAITTVLFDADGVLQRLPLRAVVGVLRGLGPRVSLREVALVEGPALTGESDFREGLAALLARHGVATPVDELLAHHHDVVIDPRRLALVDAVRAAGTTVALATNQQRHRGVHLQGLYAGRFDEAFYSFEVGAAKPDPAFFRIALDRLGVPASEVLFIDDQPRNVAAARSVGLHAERHVWPLGVRHLRGVLRRHGLATPGT